MSIANEKEPKAKKTEAKSGTWELVMADIASMKIIHRDAILGLAKERNEYGIEVHGTVLRPHNGRDSVVDAVQEIMDAIVYTKNATIEEDNVLKYMVLVSLYYKQISILDSFLQVLEVDRE